ncbi:uncharacterized protein LOC112568276 [Pomacea canaliculata]|uniref:uncharacterized protein LOC112568276 n=1 Tax=Pomacea canaliculata TaxID=400727 RepID=UPI000D731543|nr:uncharacterized protein LOC112568276 [Pomacea canaliculata]
MQEENRASDEVFHQTEHPSGVRTVLVFVLYLLCFTASTTGEKISCSVPSAELNKETQLTCFFSEDLSRSKKDFTVYHYLQQGNPDAVVDCWWLNGKLDCFMRPGFEFNMDVTNNLTVRLPCVEDNQAGTYACQVAGYRPEHLNTCELEVKPAAVAMAAQQSNQLDVEQTENLKTTCLATVEVLGKPATVTCSFGGKPSETFLVSHIAANGSEDYPLLCMLVNGAHTCEVLPEYTLRVELRPLQSFTLTA